MKHTLSVILKSLLTFALGLGLLYAYYLVFFTDSAHPSITREERLWKAEKERQANLARDQVILPEDIPSGEALYSINPEAPIPTEEPEPMMAAISRSIVKKVYAVETAEGAGAVVRRSIGSMGLRNLSPFLMLDHFNMDVGSGFPDHPHRGQVTVTYMLQGSSRHEDSEGHKGTIVAGGVQWMTAGRGIIHAEMPVHGEGLPNPVGMQLWVDLPAKHKMTPPTYQELDPEFVPVAYPNGPEGPRIRVISGKSHGVESPVRPLGGCWYMHIYLDKAGDKIFQELPAGWTAFIYLIQGSIKVNPDDESSTVMQQHHTLVLSAAANENGVGVEAAGNDVQFVLIAGEPLDQQVVQMGPFVMTSRAEIQQTILDYQMARNGFEQARTWKSYIGRRLM
jgi:hypothetical protein